jgi:hypothetical protein
MKLPEDWQFGRKTATFQQAINLMLLSWPLQMLVVTVAG